jgi:Acetokinase family
LGHARTVSRASASSRGGTGRSAFLAALASPDDRADGSDGVSIALDLAASEFRQPDGRYRVAGDLLTSADMIDRLAAITGQVFVHRLAKAIAGMVASLERLDALMFTGGIGENSTLVRSLVLGRVGFLGLAEDPAANTRHGRDTGGRVSRPGTALALVVPTDEELLIARDTARLIVTAAASGSDR